MKKTLLSLLTVGLAATVLVACAPGEKKEDVAKEIKTVRLGVMPSTDNIPFLMAHKAEMDKKAGINIELEVFKSGPDRDAAFQAGEVDGVISDLVGLALYKQGDMDVKTVAAPYDEFDLVSADESVKTVSDLKGKSVDFAELTGTAYAMDMMLKDVNMTMADIKVENIPPVPARLERLGAGQTAGAILPEPFVTIGKAKGMHVVQTTKDLGFNPFAIIFDTKFIEKNDDAIKGMMTAYNEASAYIKENDRSEFMDLFIKDVGFPEDMKDLIEVPDFGEIEAVKEADVTSALEWTIEKGLLTKEITAKDVMNNDFVK
ncbi:ABC transporter substrate-binding protein [Vagococcus coleopterorum]|uniref:ABC transporter substrate-binding protein n=1 Tax=Vagococcus coleopterorum TaxID=2714946 RepID=A0A6G8AL80_9ENTE|nr:ABC transporter substrate-binding protein [Vagococcus coleopterorum]QIL45685.1 ABC transporter substrate-binding protein [Vagococcus coleopterorum]